MDRGHASRPSRSMCPERPNSRQERTVRALRARPAAQPLGRCTDREYGGGPLLSTVRGMIPCLER